MAEPSPPGACGIGAKARAPGEGQPRLTSGPSPCGSVCDDAEYHWCQTVRDCHTQYSTFLHPRLTVRLLLTAAMSFSTSVETRCLRSRLILSNVWA